MAQVQPLFERKSNKRAREYLGVGNNFYYRSKLYEAISAYNDCLNFAFIGSSEMGEAYAYRAKCYYERNFFKKCLENIQLAREYGCPDVLWRKMEDLKNKCLKSGLTDAEDIALFGPSGLFRLSQNKKKKNAPFIINALTLRKNEGFGQHIITNKDLEIGDIIAIDEPVFEVFEREAITPSRCKFCFKGNFLSLLPCHFCTNAMYCSERCREMDKTHPYECGFTEADRYFYEQNRSAINVALTAINIAGGVRELITMFNTRHMTVFKMDLKEPDSDPKYKWKLLRAVYSLSYFNKENFSVITIGSLDRLLSGKMMKLTREDQEKLLQIVQRLHRVFEMNSFPIREDARHEVRSPEENITGVGGDTFLKKFAMSCSPFLSLINHSCTPNVRTVAVENRIVVHVTRPIRKGNQIFMNYGTESHITRKQERQEFLRNNFGFDCKCDACTGQSPLLREMASQDSNFVLPNFGNWRRSIQESSNNFHAYNLYVHQNSRTNHNFEVTVAEYYSWFLMHFISSEARKLDRNFNKRHIMFYVGLVFFIAIIFYALFPWKYFSDTSEEL